MVSKKQRKRYQKTIAKFCLMDAIFMAKFNVKHRYPLRIAVLCRLKRFIRIDI